MQVRVEDASLLEALGDWLSERGWPVVQAGPDEVDVLVPWAEDEFAASLRLRGDLAAWRHAHAPVEVTIDRDVWRRPIAS